MFSQTNLIKNNLLRSPIFSLKFFLILNICTVAYCQLPPTDPNISILLSGFIEQVGVSEPNEISPRLVPIKEANSLDSIVLKLTINNKSTKEISVLYPDFFSRTAILSFRDKISGQQIPDQVRWSIGGRSSDYINIQQGKSYEALLYLEQLYPNGISSGAYEVSLQYAPDYKTLLQSNSISLTFIPQSENEKKYILNYVKFVREGTNDIELFLKENPVGPFRNRIYLRIARDQIQSKKFESAENTLNDIISDKNVTTFQKGQSLYIKARLLKDNMGKLNEAIQCLEKSPLISGQNEAKKWKKEKDSQKK